MSYAIVATSVITLLILIRLLAHHFKKKPKITDGRNPWNYSEVREMLQKANVPLPVMIVDLDHFECNVKTIISICRRNEKRLRVATKSVRCPHLIKLISDLGSGVLSGFMCYSVAEAELLYEQGHDDFFIPYPTVLQTDIQLALKLIHNGAKICLTVDSSDMVKRLDEIIESISSTNISTVLRVSIDLDMSYRLGPLRLGVHRSNIHNIEKFAAVAKTVLDSSHLRLAGCMGYEASVAGLPDNNPYAPYPNFIIRFLKDKFFKNCSLFRGQVLKWCFKQDISLDFFNAGGSGNIEQVSTDHAVTEVTVGSAFLQGKLFDYYKDNKCIPACCFALQCTRITPEYITCQSGGFIASGGVSEDKCPVPFNNPYQLKTYTDEGYGEVQTPLQIISKNKSTEINLGDPMLFRPAKSGEIGEHFNTYLLKRGNDIVDYVPTYRGLGKVFY